MQHKENCDFVIGNGISAFAFAFYHPTCVLISSWQKTDLPFVFIQNNKYSTRLLEDLGLGFQIINIQVNPIKDVSKAIKGKGIRDFPGRAFEGTDRIANVGKNLCLEVLQVKETLICDLIRDHLARQDRLITCQVKEITASHIVLFDGRSLPYKEIAYTDHFLTLQKRSGWSPGHNISMANLVYTVGEYLPELGGCIKYIAKGPIAKMVNNPVTNSCGCEYRPDAIAPANAKIFYNARLSGHIAPPPERIYLLGRLATGNSHWRLEDSLFVAQGGYELHKMLTEQQRFDYTLQLILNKDKVSPHERIASLILHAHSELQELLREFNWRMNTKRAVKPIKATSILEEGIDVIKLVLSMFYHLQYTPREIYEMFWNKSETVWQKLLTEFYGGV